MSQSWYYARFLRCARNLRLYEAYIYCNAHGVQPGAFNDAAADELVLAVEGDGLAWRDGALRSLEADDSGVAVRIEDGRRLRSLVTNLGVDLDGA